MPRPKQKPNSRDWARIVNREWRLTTASGEVLIPVRPIDAAEARELSSGQPVYYLGYLIPVRVLTGDRAALEVELSLSGAETTGPEYNTFHLFRGDRGTEAVVVEHHH